MGYVYYIDESGNTGTNWLDATQPLLVHGGWLVPKNNVEGVRKELVSLFQLTQATVLKSKNVMNSKSKNKMIKMLFETMRRNGAVPFLTVSIKRFMISAKIVETFFDHQYNPNVNAKLTHPIELKKALAVCIYENDTYSIINKFSLLIQNRTASIADLRGISESLITLFDSRNHFLVARSLKNLSDDNFLEMIDEFETSEKNELALLMPGIFKLLTCVEIFSAKNRSPVDVYHDQLWGYSNIFELLRTTFLNKKILPINVGTNEKPILSGFEYIKSLEMKKDEDDVLLQLSDLLCGYAAKIFKNIYENNPLDAQEKEVLIQLLEWNSYVYEKSKATALDYHGTYSFEASFVKAAFPDKNIKRVNCDNIIRKEFLSVVVHV